MMGIFSKIKSALRPKNLQETIEEIEEVLLESGISPKLCYKVIGDLESKLSSSFRFEELRSTLRILLFEYLLQYEINLYPSPHAFMFIGVNGVGKTTSIAKFVDYLIHHQNVERKDIVLAAGDTFRAGAIEQIEIHSKALGVQLVKQQPGADPAAVIYDALANVQSKHSKFLIADTAGRMHNRKDLITQLQKMYRLLAKELQENQITSFLVIDASSGLNTITQAEDFLEAVHIDAIILSKYDGSSKGGSIISIAEKCKIPCAFVGTGETYKDFQVFDKEKFIDEFLSI